jgi:hypothetical protein
MSALTVAELRLYFAGTIREAGRRRIRDASQVLITSRGYQKSSSST